MMKTKWNGPGIAAITAAIILVFFLTKSYIYPSKEYTEAWNLMKTNRQMADVFGDTFSVRANDVGGVLMMGSRDNAYRAYTYGFDVKGTKKSGSVLVRITEGAYQWKVQIIEPDGDKEKNLFEKIENK